MTLNTLEIVGAMLLTPVYTTGAGLLAREVPAQVAAAQQAEPPPARKDEEKSKSAEQAPPYADRFGDSLPQGAISRLGTSRLRHGAIVSWLQFTRDGQSVISQGGDGVRIWKVNTGEQLHCFANESGPGPMPYESSSLSSDSKLLAVPGKSGVHVYEVLTGKRVQTLATGPVACARFSPDGKILAVENSGERPPWSFEFWELASSTRLKPAAADPSSFVCLAFSGDGKTLITAGSRFMAVPPANDHKIRLWEVPSGKELRHFEMGTSNPFKIAVSPDNRLLAVICLGVEGIENRIRVWDLAAGKETRQLVPTANKSRKATYFSTGLAFGPDGRTLYTAGIDGTVIAWNPVTGEELRRIGSGIASPRALAVSPDNKTLAADVGGRAIRLIDLQTGKDRFPESGHHLGVLRTAMSSDGRIAVTDGPGGVFLWNATTGRQLHRIEGETLFPTGQLVNDGRAILTLQFDPTEKAWTLRWRDLDSGEQIRRTKWSYEHNGQLGPFAVAPDRKTFIVGRYDADLITVDLETGKEIRKLRWPGKGIFLHGAAITADGRSLVLWGSDNQIRLWDMNSSRELRHFPFSDEGGPRRPASVGGGGLAFGAALSPDGRLVALGSQNGLIALHDLDTGKLVRKFESLPDGALELAFAPDGKTLAWGGYHDGIVRVVEVATGGERHRFVGHQGRVTALNFSSNGKRLVSGNDDTTALVWNLIGGHAATGKAPGSPLAPGELEALWKSLAEEDAVKGYEAICRLAAAPAMAVPFLKSRLKPVSPPDSDHVKRLVADLDSGRFAVREKASQELIKLGEVALSPCRRALEAGPTAEARRRLETILESQLRQWWSSSKDRLRALRAIEAMERASTAESIAVLESLGRGAAGARLTEEAAAACQRLKKAAKDV